MENDDQADHESHQHSEVSQERWCASCGVLLISEDGFLWSGNALGDHSCFRGARGIDVGNKFVYRVEHVQKTLQPLVVQSLPTNSGIRSSLTHVNLTPMNAKQLHHAFGSKDETSSKMVTCPKGSLSKNFQQFSPISIQKNVAEQHVPTIVRCQTPHKGSLIYQLPIYQQSIQNQSNENISLSSLSTITSGEDLPVDDCNGLTTPTSIDLISGQGSCNNSASSECKINNDEDDETIFKWSDAMIKLLLQSYNTHNQTRADGHYMTKKQLHQKILVDMKNHKYNDVTVERIANKLKRLEKSYKEKVDNMGGSQSGAATLSIKYQDELFDTFGKKHAIHPTHLITATTEYSKADDSLPDEDVQEEIKQFSVTSAGKTKAYCASTKKGKTDENYDQL
ncbi:hypothetical protein QAD02_008599 [Eretmocerus hayati]|uniref:Uncharacterized protein n=1 Tax=Eretmocerus hayati TaxID=131215 RepID=A0ACC2N7A3_9HYME|nr:hypothetical protein QAD02_008599 [Eretmocerus hayati]